MSFQLLSPVLDLLPMGVLKHLRLQRGHAIIGTDVNGNLAGGYAPLDRRYRNAMAVTFKEELAGKGYDVSNVSVLPTPTQSDIVTESKRLLAELEDDPGVQATYQKISASIKARSRDTSR